MPVSVKGAIGRWSRMLPPGWVGFHAMPDHPVRSNLELDTDTMRRIGRSVSDLVVDHLASLRDQPAQQSLSRHDTESLIAGPPSMDGRDFENLIAFLRD